MILQCIFSRFGIPRSLVSDNGPGISSAKFGKFLPDIDIIHIKKAPYHRSSNGLAERAVRRVKTVLTKVIGGAFKERLSQFPSISE